MKKPKFFDKEIEPSCKYCSNSISLGEDTGCRKKKHIKNGKCRKFSYDPLMRVPYNIAPLKSYNPEDFEI